MHCVVLFVEVRILLIDATYNRSATVSVSALSLIEVIVLPTFRQDTRPPKSYVFLFGRLDFLYVIITLLNSHLPTRPQIKFAC